MLNKSQVSNPKSQNLHSVLKNIIDRKRADLIETKEITSLQTIANQSTAYNHMRLPRRFTPRNDNTTFLIAEVKLTSPTEGKLGSEEELLERVIAYEKAGSDAISVITEEHSFHGSVSFIPKVKGVVNLPILQKDFVIDDYQIYEAKSIGSDALLLIARLVSTKTLQRFVSLCLQLGIEPVVEIANEEDLSKAIATKTRIIAVNARDLATFTVSVEKACALLEKIPEGFISLGFSGIHSSQEVNKYKTAGASGVLVGTALMKSNNITEFILLLRGVKRRSNLTK